MRVGLGIVTCERPRLFMECAASIKHHLAGVAHPIIAHHDGPDPGGYEASPVPLTFSRRREGVGRAKNRVLRALLVVDPPIDWLFLAEDDMAVTSPLAVLGYLEACRQSGFQHLNYHGHGYWKPPVRVDGSVEFYDNYAGCWSVTSRHAIEVAGVLNEAFHNSWEHVEWTLRLAQHGFTSKWREAADAVGSEAWLHEQPGTHDLSLIARLPDTGRNAEAGRAYWKRQHPETYPAELG